jgi:hypothetical protein
VVTFTGCVYQPSDDPTVYAIRRMDMDKGSSSSASSSTSADRTSSNTSQTNSSSRTGGSSSSSAGTTSSDQRRTEGAWHRLTPSVAQDLKPYVGQRVRVNGQLTPGRDPQGNDVIIQITQEKTVVTAIDLKPAPQLSIASITPLGGTCNATAASAPKP